MNRLCITYLAPRVRAQYEIKCGGSENMKPSLVPKINTRAIMTSLEFALVSSFALFVGVVNSEPKPLVLEDLVTNAENLLKSYGVKENTLTDARIYFEENVGSSDDISQTAKTVKDSFEKARDLFSVNFENVRNLDDAKTEVEVQVVKAIESLDQSNHLNS